MKKRIVYLGPNKNHAKEDLKSLALQYLKENKGDRFYYLLPNRELLQQYRNEFMDVLGATMDLNFITFDDIVNNIMESSLVNMANDPIKRIVMRKVLKQLSESSKLNYYNNFIEYKGFIESCIYIIGNIKRSLIRPQEFLSKCGDSPRFKEMAYIYEAYERDLDEKGYMDQEGMYLKSIELLKEDNSFLEYLDFIIIDEFYDFRPVELEIIGLLESLDLDIYINIPYKTTRKNRRLSETVIDLKNLNFKIDEISSGQLSEFQLLGDLMFDNNERVASANIELIKGDSLYLEIKSIISKIKNNFHYNSIDLRDNCICYLNNKYRDMIIKVVEEEKLPISIDKSVDLIKQAMAKEILNLLDFILSQGEKYSFLERVKSAYLSVCHQDLRDDYEYILRRSNFANTEDLYNKLRNGTQVDISDKYSESILEIIENLENEARVLQGQQTLMEFNKGLLSILESYDIEQNIFDRYNLNNDFELLKRDLSIIKYIKDLLNTMEANLFAKEEIGLDEYLLILIDYFEEESIIEKTGSPNGVKVVTIDNARGLEYKNIFIPGLDQRNYPNIDNNNFFFTDDNYYFLAKIGLDVKDYRNRLDNEILKFVSLISNCKEKLYLSCALDLDSSEGNNPLYSIFLDEVLYKLDGEKEEDKLKVSEVDLGFLYNNEMKNITSEREFTFRIFNDYYKENLQYPYLIYHNNIFDGKVDKINLQLESEISRKTEEFNKYRGLLEDDSAREYISESFKNKSVSVTFIEDYSICPFAFLLKNIFKIELLDREVEDFSPMTSGSIYHEVLRIYYENFRDDFNNIQEVNFQAHQDFLRQTVEDVARNEGYSLNNKVDLLMIEDIYNRLIKFIEYDIDRLKKHTDVKPWKFEEWFNMVHNIGNETINIRGIIDRIDKINDDKYVIIDYKSSLYGKQTIDQIDDKTSLQLPIYILSQADKNVVGGFYGIINGPDFFTCIGIVQECNLVKSREKGGIDREHWDKLLSNTKVTIGELFKGILEGNFSVAPRHCSKYCNYKDICRYDKAQEVE